MTVIKLTATIELPGEVTADKSDESIIEMAKEVFWLDGVEVYASIESEAPFETRPAGRYTNLYVNDNMLASVDEQTDECIIFDPTNEDDVPALKFNLSSNK